MTTNIKKGFLHSFVMGNLLLPLMFSSVYANSTFTDIDGSYAKEAINALSEKNIIDGVSSDAFNPKGNLTREQFSKIVVLSLGLKADSQKSSFVDVSGWSVPYIEAAKAAGLINGVGKGKFDPKGTLTREQAAKIIVNALKLKSVSLDESSELNFKDKNDISDWAKPYVSISTKNSIIQGFSDGTFKPKSYATREQAALLAYRLYKLTYDTEAPSPAKIISPLKYTVSSNKQVEVIVQAEKDASVNILEGTKLLASGIGNGSENVTIPTYLELGTHKLNVMVIDKAGNKSTPVFLPTIVIINEGDTAGDTTPPDSPVLTNANHINKKTDQSNYFIMGNGEIGTKVEIVLTDGTTPIKVEGNVESDGNFNVKMDPSAFPEGNLNLSVTLIDDAGNKSTPVTKTIIKDLIMSDPTWGTLAEIKDNNQASYTIGGKGSAGDRIDISATDGNQSKTSYAIVDNSGNFSSTMDVSRLKSGTVTIKAIQSDLAGNQSSEISTTVQKTSFSITAKPVINNSGYINMYSVSNYKIEGKAAAYATVNITVTDGTKTLTTNGTVSNTSTYSVPINATGLKEGNITIKVSQSDGKGYTSPENSVVVQKDTTRPFFPTGIDGYESSNGTVDNQNKLRIMWTDSATYDADKHEIWRSDAAGQYGTKVGEVNKGVQEFNEVLPINSTWYYTIVGRDKAGNGTATPQQFQVNIGDEQ